MEVIRSFSINQKSDLQTLTEFLRTFYDTTHGVPLSLACSASYLEFRVQCFQSLLTEVQEQNFEAFLGDSIHVAYSKGTVTVSRRCIQTHQQLTAASPENDDKDDDEGYLTK